MKQDLYYVHIAVDGTLGDKPVSWNEACKILVDRFGERLIRNGWMKEFGKNCAVSAYKGGEVIARIEYKRD